MSVRGLAAKLLGARGPRKPRVALAAFGKHPGWDDHIEDLGLETPFLTDLKRLLYIEGIGGNIDAGTWQRLEPRARLPDFGHAFVRLVGAHAAAGRVWPSRDGRGRAAYPMIACTHAADLPRSWTMLVALPRLEQVERDCRAATTAAAVTAALEHHRAALRRETDAIPPVPEPRRVGSGQVLASLAASPDLGPDARGLVRALYQIERDCAPWLPVKSSTTTTRRRALRPGSGCHLRLPGGGGTAADRLWRWAEAMGDIVVPATPLLLLTPHERDWVDLVVGAAGAERLFCLMADEPQLPLTTTVPFAIDADFESRTRERLGLAPRSGVRPGPPGARGGSA